jgi:hypothetical protein
MYTSKFDMTSNLKKFTKFLGTKQAVISSDLGLTWQRGWPVGGYTTRVDLHRFRVTDSQLVATAVKAPDLLRQRRPLPASSLLGSVSFRPNQTRDPFSS